MSGSNTIHVERTITNRLQRYEQSITNVEHKLAVARGEAANKAGQTAVDPIGEAGALADLERLHTDRQAVVNDLKSAQALIAALNL